MKINLLGMSLDAMEKFFVSLGEKPYRARQVFQWIHQKGISNLDEMSNLSKDLRSILEEKTEIKAPEIIYEKDSKDGTRKWVLSVGEGDLVEMVLIPEGKRATLCVSSQVGCAVDCSFCATGKQGFSRNLSTAEIIGQVWVAENSFGIPRDHGSKNVTNVVMMTLSTSGLVPMIDKLSEVTDAALTISLHAPNDKLRNDLVPVNKKYPIKKLLDAVTRYVEKCGDQRKTTMEYILINKVNDSIDDAKELAKILRDIPSKINLIPFNPFPGTEYKRPSNMRVETFKKILQKEGYITTVRTTRGEDIMAACGQLVGKVNDKTRRKERSQNKGKQIATKLIS